ncbi:hypothetical protein K1W54_09590 [Micromonospora sp. CPCC 205371]|nr:hypothetical protein [Micromonospora sp. CPCC 205371]
MSTNRGNRIDRVSAERLLRGGLDVRETGSRRLADLLAAAAAPHSGGPVAGETAAMAAFRAAQVAPDSGAQRRSMLKTALAKIGTVKVAAVCAAVLGVGGVAAAATSSGAAGPLGFAGFGGPRAESPRPTTKPTGTPSPRPDHSVRPEGLVGLCHEYIGRDRDHRKATLDDRRFNELADRAGGRDRDKADRFCDDLLRRWPSASPKERPSGTPSGTPSPRSTDRPYGDRPGGQNGGQDGDRDSKPTSTTSARPEAPTTNSPR